METCPTVLMDKPQQQASLAELRALKQRREDDLINMKVILILQLANHMNRLTTRCNCLLTYLK